jgi:hypothetical protein
MRDFVTCARTSREPIDSGLCPGKQALEREHIQKVQCTDEKRWTASINLDATLQRRPRFAQSSRWDYGLGYIGPQGLESAVWVEVHSAETSKVSEVITKLDWLKEFLQQECLSLWKLTMRGPEGTRFVWIASGRYNIPAHMPQLRKLQSKGLDPPRRSLKLP